MGKIYKNQTALQINFNLGDDITNYDSITASVLKPDGSLDSWILSVSDASTGACTFSDFTTTNLSTSGTYYIQPQVTFSDATVIKGETNKLIVYDNFE